MAFRPDSLDGCKGGGLGWGKYLDGLLGHLFVEVYQVLLVLL